MRIHRLALEGGRSLAANKLRTFFMMAGTILGIAALTVIMAVGRGTEKKVMRRVNTFGPHAMMLIAGGGKDLPPPDITVTTLTLGDAQAIRESISDVDVCPMAWKFRMSVKRGAEQRQARVWGTEANWHEAWNIPAIQGEELSDQDVVTMARVCLIGATVKRELFGDADPVGDHIYVNKVKLKVKGVLKPRDVSPIRGMDFNNYVVVPITTAMRRVMNVDHLGAIRITTKDPALLDKQAKAIKALMHRRHHITPPQEDDFRIITAQVIAKLSRGISGTLSILLMALAGLSLLVGGVVMMNILLISVRERVKEIGLRRAVGATQRDIFLQFLSESLSVTLSGMLVGSALGLAVAVVLAKTTKIPAVISWEAFALAACFALLIGTFFGVQPARGAARLRPIQALQ